MSFVFKELRTHPTDPPRTHTGGGRGQYAPITINIKRPSEVHHIFKEVNSHLLQSCQPENVTPITRFLCF